MKNRITLIILLLFIMAGCISQTHPTEPIYAKSQKEYNTLLKEYGYSTNRNEGAISKLSDSAKLLQINAAIKQLKKDHANHLTFLRERSEDDFCTSIDTVNDVKYRAVIIKGISKPEGMVIVKIAHSQQRILLTIKGWNDKNKLMINQVDIAIPEQEWDDFIKLIDQAYFWNLSSPDYTGISDPTEFFTVEGWHRKTINNTDVPNYHAVTLEDPIESPLTNAFNFLLVKHKVLD